MLSISWKNLFQDKGRFLISIGGIAFAVLLILVLQGLYIGWNEKMTVYINSVETDLWVAEQGTQDLFHTPSYLSESLKGRLLDVAGVEEVNEVLQKTAMINLRDEKKMMMIVGFDVDSGLGGPPEIIKGKAVPQDGEIIIDKVLAKTEDLEIGDELDILGRREKIVGISSGGDMVVVQANFVNIEEAKRIFKIKDIVNYFLVKAHNKAEVNNVASKIEDQIKVDAFSVADFSQNNQKLIQDAFLPMLLVLVIVGFIVGVAVTGLTIYTLTQEKYREYGVLKAIGANNKQLYSIVFQQSMVSAVLGFIVGAGAAYIATFLIERFVPQFVTTFRWIDFGWVFGATILIALIASCIPIKKISGIDPAIVFKV